MRRLVLIPLVSLAVLSLIITLSAAAQEAVPELVVADVQIETRTDPSGIEAQVAAGVVFNNTPQAATNITLIGDVYGTDDALIGEGFGYVVDECGTALTELILQPGESWTFEMALDLFETDVEIGRVIVTPQWTALAPDDTPPQVFNGIATISDNEVVAVEWIDAQSLRYAVGCRGQVFLNHDWYQYDLLSRQSTPITHPAADLVTADFIAQSGITSPAQGGDPNPLLLNTSHLTFPPDGSRVIYQNDIHSIYTAERNGSFRRLIHEELFRHSLQGIVYIPGGRFLAYYFGVYGEPVLYFTATTDGQMISAFLTESVSSVTVPGPTSDGQWVVVGATHEEGTGYYLQSTLGTARQFLFPVDSLPGNNWPAPIYVVRDATTTYVYVIRPIDGQAWLQCYNREANELYDLTPLPIQMDTTNQAWSWLSPDATRLALAANGVNGGLWVVNLFTFMVCQ